MAKKEFFLKTVPLLDGGDDVAMVLSPQCFHNMDLHTDIFNHSNVSFFSQSSALCRSHFCLKPAIFFRSFLCLNWIRSTDDGCI